MDDTAAGVAIGLLALVALHGLLNGRAARAAESQVRESFTSSSRIHAEVHEQAPFGLLANNLRALDVYGDKVVAIEIPFFQTPRSGWKGHIQHLRLHLVDATISGVAIKRLDADIPNVTYDLGHAFYKDRLLIRDSDEGAVTVVMDQSGLAEFATRKYRNLVRNIIVVVENDRVTMGGSITVMGAAVPFAMNGLLTVRAGRFIEISASEISLGGVPVAAEKKQNLLARINPLLDVDNDLHLGGLLRVQHITGRAGQIVLDGAIGLPVVQSASRHHAALDVFASAENSD